MLLLMGITFFTSRVVLDKLGVEGYGIYNVVSSLAVSFSFFLSSLTNATQRFITIEIGKGNVPQAKKIFNQHLEVYALIALACFIIGEIVGVWFTSNPQLLRVRRFCQQKKGSIEAGEVKKQVIGSFVIQNPLTP